MYDPRIDPKSDAAKHLLFKVRRILQYLHRNFELYLGPVWDLSIGDKTIGFQGTHKDKLQITFKDAGDGFQGDDVTRTLLFISMITYLT